MSVLNIADDNVFVSVQHNEYPVGQYTMVYGRRMKIANVKYYGRDLAASKHYYHVTEVETSC